MQLRSLIVDHFWLKLFSVVLAALIWAAVHGDLGESPALDRRLTREFLNRPVLLLTENTAHPDVQVSPDRVSVFVHGPSSVLNELRERDIQVFVRLAAGRASGAVPVRVHTPAGVTVSRIDPLTVTVKPVEYP